MILNPPIPKPHEGEHMRKPRVPALIALVAMSATLCAAAAIAMAACAPARPTAPPSRTPASPTAGTVEGRIFWNEQPVVGAYVYATSEYNFSSTHYGDATTDAQGRFSISAVPAGRKYLYVFGTGRPFWVTAVTPFVMSAGQGTVAPDTYLCKGFDPISPQQGESLSTNRPELKWDPYPEAVDYAVRVLRTGQSTFVFRRGDDDPHVTDTSIHVAPELGAGEYTWRVDAFNRLGHIIGCSYYPRLFTVNGPQTPATR
jgi:hypothetical protein